MAKPPTTSQKCKEIRRGYGHSQFITRGMMKLMEPNITIVKKPYSPRWACAIVKWVKWVTPLTERNDSSDPSTDAAVYITAPKPMKRSVGEYRNARKLPSTVMC